MAHLAISLLGHFEVTLDGRPLTRFGTDKTRALLAYLAVEADRAHRREMLAGLLWPECPEAAAHHNLSQSLLLLRKALGDKTAAPYPAPPPFLLATGRTLRFNPASDWTLDVAVFQAGLAVCASAAPEQLGPEDARTLTQAVELYRGEFLSDPWLINSVAFDEWRLFKQAQLHLQMVEALDYLVHYHERRGEFALAAEFSRRQIALDPLRESAHRQLMQSLALDGRGPEALAHYAACQTLLAQELGIAPAPETTVLYERIRAARVAGTPPPLNRQQEKPVTGPLVPPPAFVGRARELAHLTDVMALTLKGQGQVMFVTGEAGSGKTALLNAFARRALAARADLVVVNGSGNAYTGLGDPYWPFIEMLRQLRGEADSGIALLRSQAQHLATARPVIAPILAECGPGLERFFSEEGQTAGGPGLEQSGLFEQITRVLQTVASHYPLVLLLDDLQWADRDSLNLLFHLGRRLAGQRLLLVGAFRSDVLHPDYSPSGYLHEQDTGQRHPLAALVHELQRCLGEIQIDLAQAEGQAFIDALLDSEPNHLGPEFRETLYRHTGGHALFTTELLRGMQESGDLVRDAQGFWVAGVRIAWHAFPARVEAVIAERIGQLLPEWQAMLAAASVEGDEFTVQVLARAQDLPEEQVSRRLSGALSRHHYLVVPVGVQQVGPHSLARYRFRHLLFQRYLYHRLDPVEQAQLHLTVGRTLETLYAGHAHEISLPLARHFELGGHTSRAVAYLLEAGKRAAQLAATEEALRLLTHGLALLDRMEKSPEREQQEVALQLTLGAALLARGWSAPERAQAIERAYDLCQRVGTPGQLAHSLLLVADVNLARGQLSQVMAIGEQLLTLAQSTQDALTAISAHYTLGAAFTFMGQFPQARQHLEQVTTLYDPHAYALATLTGADISVSSRVWLVNILGPMGYADQAAERSRQAVASARDLGHAISLSFALSIGELGMGWFRRDPQALRATLRQLAALSSDASLGFFHLWAAIFQGWLLAVDGHDPAGLIQIQQAINQWETSGTLGGSVYHYVLLVEAYLALGQVEAALVTLDRILAQVAATGLRFFEVELLRLRGEALRMLGRPAEAEVCLLNAITVAREQTARSWELRAVLSLCQLRQAEGTPAQFEAARQQLAELLAWFSEGWDTPDLQAAAALVAETAPPTSWSPQFHV